MRELFANLTLCYYLYYWISHRKTPQYTLHFSHRMQQRVCNNKGPHWRNASTFLALAHEIVIISLFISTRVWPVNFYDGKSC